MARQGRKLITMKKNIAILIICLLVAAIYVRGQKILSADSVQLYHTYTFQAENPGYGNQIAYNKRTAVASAWHTDMQNNLYPFDTTGKNMGKFNKEVLTFTGPYNDTSWCNYIIYANPLFQPGFITQSFIVQAEDYTAKTSSIIPVNTNDVGGGQHLVGMVKDSWVDYTINTPVAGVYKVKFRIATPGTGAQFQIKNGTTILGTVTMHSSGAWDMWKYDSANIQLSAGGQTIRVQVATASSSNFNFMEFSTTVTGGDTVQPLLARSVLYLTKKELDGKVYYYDEKGTYYDVIYCRRYTGEWSLLKFPCQ